MSDSLQKSVRLVEWLAQQIDGLRIKGDRRSRLAAISFGVAQDHEAAVTTLLTLTTPLTSSAFALGRPIFEAYVRGMWLAHCATDEQIERYLDGKVPDMVSLIVAIEKLGEDISNLRKIYDQSWKGMSGLTHTGVEHANRWTSDGVLTPAYDANEVDRFVDFVSRIGVLSVTCIAQLACDDQGRWQRILNEARALMPRRFESESS